MYNSLFETGLPIEKFFDGFYDYAMDAAEALRELKGSTLLLSPTPGVGFLRQTFGEDEGKMDRFLKESAQCMNRIGADVKKLGINAVIRNEFWTMLRGSGIDAYMGLIDPENVSFAPDPAHLMIAGADYLEMFRKYADKAKAVCFTDTKFRDPDNVYKTISPEFPQDGATQRVYWDLGYGDVDFDEIYKILKSADFDGPVLLESKYSLDIPKGILRLRTFWNRLEKNYAKREA